MLGLNCDVLVGDALPLEVEVEVAFIRQLHLLGPRLVHKELPEVELAGFARRNTHLGLISHYRVVDLVALSLNVERQWSVLALNIALQVVIVGQLKLRVELDLDWAVTESRNDTRHWRHFQ